MHGVSVGDGLASVALSLHRQIETQVLWVRLYCTGPSGRSGRVAVQEACLELSKMSGETILGRDVDSGNLIGLDAEARRRGTYVIGLTGTGKTTLLLNIVLHDIAVGDGLCLLDPHGDLTEDLLRRVPEHRVRDVILFDPADTGRPFGLNLFECADPADPHAVDLVCSQAVGTFRNLYSYSWGPQLEDLLRNVALTLIYTQPGTTMADIPRLLTDEKFRAKLVANIPDSADQVKRFWEKTYNPLGRRYPHKQVEYSLSTLNKVRRFLVNTAIRNVVGQETSSIDMREIMDDGKILLVNLAKGKLGEDNSSLLGSIVVGKLLIAALSRADTPFEKRRPFHLIVDEFQNFATASFAVLQSEARKYNIDTVVAHQFRDQLDQEIRGSTLNVGNLVVFRISGRDARALAREFDTTPPEPRVIGERAQRALTHSPWSALAKGSHMNPRVGELVKWLSWILRVGVFYKFKGVDKGTAWHPLDTYKVVTFLDAAEVEACVTKVDAYLSARMRGVPDSALLDIRNDIVRSGPFNYAGDHYDYTIDPIAPEPLGALAFSSSLQEVRQRLERLYPDRMPGLMQTLITRVQLKRQFWDRVQELGNLLEQEPVFCSTGQMEPIFESQRLYSDVEAEISNQLSTLNVFRARCKLISGHRNVEQVIETLPPPPILPGGESRFERIRAWSRQKYGRSRSVVERRCSAHEARGAASDSNLPGFWGE